MTLFEILLAAALLLALAALAMPNLMATLGERRFNSALDDLHSQLLMARAHAERTGVPVEVVYMPDPPRVVARTFEPASRAIDMGEYRDASREDSFAQENDAGALDLQYEREDPADRITESWARLELPDGVRLAHLREEVDAFVAAALDDWEEEDDGELLSDFDEMLNGPPSVRIAVYLPDGSALLSREVWVIDAADDQLGRIVINAWTGLPETKRLAPYEFAQEDAEEEEDEYAEEEEADDWTDSATSQPRGGGS